MYILRKWHFWYQVWQIVKIAHVLDRCLKADMQQVKG